MHAEDRKPVITVNGNKSLAYVFNVILQSGVSGVAIVDPVTGKITGKICEFFII